MKWVVRTSSEDHEVDVETTREGLELVIRGQRRRVDFTCLDSSLASMRLLEDNRSFEVLFQRQKNGRYRIAIGERLFDLEVLSPVDVAELSAAAGAEGPSRLEAPIPGRVVAIKVGVGDEVEAGQPLVVLEAMKMENELSSDRPGRVTEVCVEPGMTVETGAVLVKLE